MTVNTECGLLLTYVPTYRKTRVHPKEDDVELARCGPRLQAAVATLVGQLVQLTPRSTPTPDAALRAFARRFRGPPPRFKGAQARAQARAQGLRRELPSSGPQAVRRELRVAAGPAAVPRRGAKRFSSWSHQSKSVLPAAIFYRLRPKLTCASPPSRPAHAPAQLPPSQNHIHTPHSPHHPRCESSLVAFAVRVV